MTVYFKNGGTVEITKEVAKILMQNIQKGINSGTFQIFTTDDGPVLFIQLSEIVYIK